MEPVLQEAKGFLEDLFQEAAYNGTAIIKAAARTLDFALRNGGQNISNEMEIGFTILQSGKPVPLHLRAPVAWVLKASTEDLFSRFTVPPAPLGNFPSHPAERRWPAAIQQKAIAA